MHEAEMMWIDSRGQKYSTKKFSISSGLINLIFSSRKQNFSKNKPFLKV
jgi:hypothetical protein